MVVQKNTKIGGITPLQSVSFMVGWLDGWMVGYVFFFPHSHSRRVDDIPELREVKPRFARNNQKVKKNVVQMYMYI